MITTYKFQKMNITMNFAYNVISFSIPGQLRDTIVLTDGLEVAAYYKEKDSKLFDLFEQSRKLGWFPIPSKASDEP